MKTKRNVWQHKWTITPVVSLACLLCVISSFLYSIVIIPGIFSLQGTHFYLKKTMKTKRNVWQHKWTITPVVSLVCLLCVISSFLYSIVIIPGIFSLQCTHFYLKKTMKTKRNVWQHKWTITPVVSLVCLLCVISSFLYSIVIIPGIFSLQDTHFYLKKTMKTKRNVWQHKWTSTPVVSLVCLLCVITYMERTTRFKARRSACIYITHSTNNQSTFVITFN